ncbi:lytic transglycosylase catalytic [Sodalis sp. (in: enterobacteria)]|uniref:lytic transglycosylase catalytic n=1 Tax=Sodalis sp. (in: enterobacteria) TaxID=1898979 RepID=UPI003F33014D
MRKFERVLTGVTTNVLKLGVAVEGAALSVLGFTTQIAAGLDKVYWASQRTGTSAAGIKALGYAAAQTGSSAEAAQGALESLARFMRNNPGAEGFLNRLGVQTRDARAQMRDMSAIFTGVGQKLGQMPYYRANQYAQMLGIDENTLMAMRRGLNGFTADYQSMLSRTGFNAEKAAAQSNKFMTSMKGLTALFGILRDKVGANLAGGLAGSLDDLRKKILENFPKIEDVLTQIVRGMIRAGEMVGRVIWRLVQAAGQIFDWWRSLDGQSKKVITTFGALTAAIWALNRAFFSSPMGIITGLAAAILLLWDDYQTWKEGGKSFIDWSKWGPEIEQAKKAFAWIGDKITGLVNDVGGWQNTLNILATFIAGAWVSKVLGAFGKIAGLPIPPWLKLWGLYAGYLVSDRENIVTSAKASWDYNTRQIKRGVGDSLKALGIDNAWASKHRGDASADPLALPRGIRNNNPGNLNYAGQAGAERESPGGRFARFQTPFEGLRAMALQLARYAGRGLNTIEKIINTWAPGSENNTGAYIAAISRQLGVAPDAALNLGNPQLMASLMGGIIQHENGRNPYSSELIDRAALAGIGGKSLQQETTINVYGASDPATTGTDIADRQTGVNARLIGQFTQRVY